MMGGKRWFYLASELARASVQTEALRARESFVRQVAQQDVCERVPLTSPVGDLDDARGFRIRQSTLYDLRFALAQRCDLFRARLASEHGREGQDGVYPWCNARKPLLENASQPMRQLRGCDAVTHSQQLADEQRIAFAGRVNVRHRLVVRFRRLAVDPIDDVALRESPQRHDAAFATDLGEQRSAIGQKPRVDVAVATEQHERMPIDALRNEVQER
jgi:hypothetical protein